MSIHRLIIADQKEAAKQYDLASRYLDVILKANRLGTPDHRGVIRGPYGNARNPEDGWYFSWRIIKSHRIAMKKAAVASANARALMRIDA